MYSSDVKDAIATGMFQDQSDVLPKLPHEMLSKSVTGH